MGLFTSLWAGLQGLGGVLLPMFSNVRLHGIANFLRWVLHFVMLAAVLVGLWYLNWYFDLEKVLRSPWPILHKVWLPLLFFLLYLLAWLAYGLWNLLGPEREAAEFPDIDAAWAEALRALGHASIGITDAPLYLVLGKPAGGEDSLFNAAHLQLAVQQTPRRADAPLHVYANRDAIFVTSTDACLLSAQAQLVAEHERTTSSATAPSMVMAATNARAEAEKPPADIAAQVADPVMAPAAQAVATQAVAAIAAVEAGPARPLLKNKEALQHCRARLAYLCRLIAQERRPYCPVNGLVVVVPLAAAEGDAEASHLASLVQMDLQTARAALQVECPLYVLVADLERAPGFREYLQRIPEPQRSRPLGQRFPLVPDVDPHELTRVFEGGIDALCQHALPGSIYGLFQLEAAQDSATRLDGALTANARLYQFLAYFRMARKRLGRLLQRGTQSDPATPSMLAGCFFAATGVDARVEQAFVAGVFQEVLENQNFVCWTPQALQQECSYRRLATIGYVGLVLVIAIVAAGVYWLTT